jgi:predicted outer membrane lipoprotein
MKGTRSDRGMERLAWILGALIALALFGIIALTFGM